MSIVYLQLISIPVVGDVSSTVSRSLCESQDLIDLIFQRCSNSMCIYISIGVSAGLLLCFIPEEKNCLYPLFLQKKRKKRACNSCAMKITKSKFSIHASRRNNFPHPQSMPPSPLLLFLHHRSYTHRLSSPQIRPTSRLLPPRRRRPERERERWGRSASWCIASWRAAPPCWPTMPRSPATSPPSPPSA
jgi:hypothetical protein